VSAPSNTETDDTEGFGVGRICPPDLVDLLAIRENEGSEKRESCRGDRIDEGGLLRRENRRRYLVSLLIEGERLA